MPVLGKSREVKKALEAYWSGNADADATLSTMRDMEAHGEIDATTH